jgi:DNA-directed RNA polymerase specialized sigma24 family protein
VDQAAFDEERDRLLVALEGLSPTDRLLIIGRSFDRLSFSELAQQLGKPSPDAARVGFARAMSRLALFFERR